MNTLIFADVHLKVPPDEEDTLREFTRFLNNVDPARFNRIVILGDLFDFWFEYKHVIFSGFFDPLRALAGLSEKGIEIHLVCGNHDFWAGSFFERQLGMIIHRGPYACAMGGKSVLFVHGDGVSPKDYSYRIYRRFARWRPIVWLFGRLHPDWAMAIAQRISSGSRSRFAHVEPSKGRNVEPLRVYAKGIIARGEADVVLCGHSHHADILAAPSPSGTGQYINTGDWMRGRTYVEWDGAAFQVLQYDPAAWAADNEGIALARLSHGVS